MKLAALISGGKDSLYAIYLAKKQGYDVTYLLSMISQSSESYMFHHPNINLTKVHAEIMGIPLLVEETLGEKERELADLERLISKVKNEVDGILTGAIASNYQMERIDRICRRSGLKSISPLWHINPERYWNDLLNSGFRIMISSVSAEGLGEKWLGRIIDEKAINELKELNRKIKIHLGFEGGEAETLVLDCPMFRRRIEVIEAKKKWDGQSGTYIINSTKLSPKNEH